MKLYRNTKCSTKEEDEYPVYGYVNTECNIQPFAQWCADKVCILKSAYYCGDEWILIPVPNNTGIHDATT